jgi:hypothetical protein
MVNPWKPTLPRSRPYRQPLNYFAYVKDFDLDVHVNVFYANIKENGEIEDAKNVNMFSFTLRNIIYGWCNNYMGDYPICIFVKL